MPGDLVRVTFTVQLPFRIKKDEGWFVSCCPVLDVYSQGKTEKKAIENLREAISLFLLSCFEAGTLDEVLKECGLQPMSPKSTKKPRVPRKTIDVSIPLTAASPELCRA